MENYSFFDRDLSWLSFNERILQQAAQDDIPVLERVNFLSIFSSNLDEFYRVRMPVLSAMDRLGKLKDPSDTTGNPLLFARQQILLQQERFGKIFTEQIIPVLQQNNIHLLFNEPPPVILKDSISDYFYSQVMAFLQPVELSAAQKKFFPQNNQLYFLIDLTDETGTEKVIVLNIPSDQLPRFFRIDAGDKVYILFLDDIVRYNLDKLFKTEIVKGCYSFKITRDAELDLKDEYPGDLSEQIEQQLLKRDLGIATRFLHQTGIPLPILNLVSNSWGIQESSIVQGGIYHNLKDLSGLPVDSPEMKYDKWPAIFNSIEASESIFACIEKKDMLINTPYQSYGTILRFFNEAALDESVEEVYVTLYRIARDSLIANALINAAAAGKKVTVLVELKARFDEANNIKWAKRMKTAGVNIIYSITALKVHAKVVLVKKKVKDRIKYYGLLATGNFNENTAAFYTDHILMTANGAILREMELLFIFLAKREKPKSPDLIRFDHLLVARFNLQQRFLEMIEREIDNAAKGLQASIVIKLNNLEEQVLIAKLYEASQAGVKVSLIVRSICCLIPGVKGMSENITVKRIVDRYLEHGRAFIFHNNGNPEVYLGSADWMNRNIYRRIEVCFPVYDAQIKAQIMTIINLQLQDNKQAVMLNENLENVKIETNEPVVQSQRRIYEFLKSTLPVFVLAFFILLAGLSCINKQAYDSPQGYNLNAPVKYYMPQHLKEISGIDFYHGKSDSLYAEEDESGRVYYFHLGDQQVNHSKFGKAGDYEDIAILGEQMILLRSDGVLFTFPFKEVRKREIQGVRKLEGILPEGEYEGLYADEKSNQLYVLCKSCSNDKNNGGYIFKLLPDGSVEQTGTFGINVKEIGALLGKKKIAFRPSALAKNQHTQEWYILSSVNKLLVVTDTSWKIKAVYPIDPALFIQPEGIAFDDKNNLYISNEGDKITPGTVFKFDYRK